MLCGTTDLRPTTWRRRRHRLRDHARDPGKRPPERAPAPSPPRSARDAAARVHPPRLLLGADGKLAEARRGARLPRCATRGFPRKRYAPTWRSSACRHDVRYDLGRIGASRWTRSRSLPDVELAARVGAPVGLVPALRGAGSRGGARRRRSSSSRSRSWGEARRRSSASASCASARAAASTTSSLGPAPRGRSGRRRPRALRMALTGRDRGPELAAVVAALDRDETLRRIDAAL